MILVEKGHDRIAIGSSVPDPNSGPRIGSASGIILNDEIWFERSEHVLINFTGQNRVVLGLDNSGGIEGISLGLFKDGSAGLTIGSDSKSIFLGRADSSYNYDGARDFNGLRVHQDVSEISYSIQRIKSSHSS